MLRGKTFLDQQSLRDDLARRIRSKIFYNEPLSRHTSLRVGGPAWAWIPVLDTDDLFQILQTARENGLLTAVVGGGCNLLPGDSGFPGIALNFRTPFFRKMEQSGGELRVGAGVSTDEMIAFCRREGFSGLECMTCVPGTIGGSVFGNAGSHGEAIGDRVKTLLLLNDKGELVRRKKSEVRFGYRTSDLEGNIVLEATFDVFPEDPRKVETRYRERLRFKQATQDLTRSNAGCIFKNPPPPFPSSGELIDRAGLKGESVGDAEVSEKHANFIVNRGQATAGDVFLLIERIQKRVKEEHGCDLELEVRLL